MYDRGGRILQIEATSNDITSFRHYRKVEHKDGSSEHKVAALKKVDLQSDRFGELMAAACRPYLDFIGTVEDHSAQRHDLDQISRTAHDQRGRCWRGFNFFLTEDLSVLLALVRGEFSLNDLNGRRLRHLSPHKTSGRIGRILKRLRLVTVALPYTGSRDLPEIRVQEMKDRTLVCELTFPDGRIDRVYFEAGGAARGEHQVR